MTRVIVAGVAGRMGQRISYMVHNNPQLELSAAFEHPDSPAIGRDVGENGGFGTTGIKIAPGLETVIEYLDGRKSSQPARRRGTNDGE